MTNHEHAENRIQRPPAGDVLDLSGVANLLGVHPVTVRRLRKLGRFPVPVMVGVGTRESRWLRSEILEWVRRGGAGNRPADEGLQVRGAERRGAERRSTPAAGRGLVARSEGGRRVLSGYGAVFYRASDPGTEYELDAGLFERIMPGAFDRSLREKPDVISLFNHSPDLLLGRTSAGTLRLSADGIGLRYEIDLPDTRTGDEVFALANRGDLRGSSFTFVPVESRRSVEGGRSIIERVDATLYELGPVVSPAYPSTTTAAGTRGGRAVADADAVDVTLAVMGMAEAEPLTLAERIGVTSAACRKLASDTDRERIAAAVANLSSRRTRGTAVRMCASCGQPSDTFGCDWCD